MAENKTKSTDASVADYIVTRANEEQRADCKALMSIFADPEKPKFGTLKGTVTALDPDWWKPMTNDEVEAFLDGR